MEDTRPSRGTVRFSVFEVDLHAGELRKTGVRIKLQEQPFRILQMLLERPGEVVSRDELRNRIWPADTFVDFDQGLNNAIKRLREALNESAETPRFIETIPRRGYRFIGNLGGVRGRVESLAVLPLDNLSGDPEQEYFADGLTEALISNLAKISALRVVSRTTAMHYKGSRRPLPEIARELRVDGIVEGTVLRSGVRVRISAQLIEARTDSHLWAESYDRDMRDILDLQSEVAHAIAREVQVKLTPQEHAQLAQTRPVDPQAYEAYLKGRYYWNRRSGEGLNRGIEYFQEAIENDPTYAAAYAGLADSAGSLGWWGFASPEKGCGRAKTAALKALELDGSLAEAHASLGWAVLHYDLDHRAAEREFQRAIELSPTYPTAHQWYGHALVTMGRADAGLGEVKQALRLDPVSLIINVSFGGLLWLIRRYDDALEHSRKILELDPKFLGMRWSLGLAYLGKGRHELAAREFEEAIKLSGGAPIFLAELGCVYAAAGKADRARKILGQLSELSIQHYINSYWRAQIYAGLNQTDVAFHWLEAAFEERSAWRVYAKLDPKLDSLRSEPRYQDLLRRVNFPV